MIADRIQKIPEKYRRTFYSLPLFIQWIPGITFETDGRILLSPRRAMGFFILYMIGMLVVQLTTGLIFSFAPSTDVFLSWINFVLQGLMGLVYGLGSLSIAYMEFSGRQTTLLGPLERVSLRFEEILSK